MAVLPSLFLSSVLMPNCSKSLMQSTAPCSLQVADTCSRLSPVCVTALTVSGWEVRMISMAATLPRLAARRTELVTSSSVVLTRQSVLLVLMPRLMNTRTQRGEAWLMA